MGEFISEMRWFGGAIANYILLGMLLFLTANSAIANWTGNIPYDFLFARVRGPLFYQAHASSILILCAAGFFLIWKTKKIGVSVLAIFATASIHELMLAAYDWAFLRIYSGISFLDYSLPLLVFLGLAWKFCLRWEKKRLLLITLFISILYLFGVIIPIPGMGGTVTVTGFEGTEYFNDLGSNALEVFSWVAPSSLWFIPWGVNK